MAPPRRIVGFGGGFGGSGPGSTLDDYVLGLSGQDHPKVLYLPTPVADDDTSIVSFYDRFARRAGATHLKLFGAPDASRWRPLVQEEELRRPRYRELVAAGFPAGYAAEDGVGLHFEGTALKEAVTDVDGRKAYRVEVAGGAVRETELSVRLLA